MESKLTENKLVKIVCIMKAWFPRVPLGLDLSGEELLNFVDVCVGGIYFCKDLREGD